MKAFKTLTALVVTYAVMGVFSSIVSRDNSYNYDEMLATCIEAGNTEAGCNEMFREIIK